MFAVTVAFDDGVVSVWLLAPPFDHEPNKYVWLPIVCGETTSSVRRTPTTPVNENGVTRGSPSRRTCAPGCCSKS